MEISKDQILFNRNMLWSSTISGSFQRSYAYKSVANDSQKQEFRDALRKKLEEIEMGYQNAQVSCGIHIKNILILQDFSKDFQSILNNGKLNFGICQKLLNLHLKGAWCYGFLHPAPPHFPVDRIIQEKLNLSPIVPWTKIKSEVQYTEIIDNARSIAESHKIGLAELELKVYNGSLIIKNEAPK